MIMPEASTPRTSGHSVTRRPYWDMKESLGWISEEVWMEVVAVEDGRESEVISSDSIDTWGQCYGDVQQG